MTSESCFRLLRSFSMHTKPKPQYPTSCSDADLANKFADFFTEKIVRIQNSLDSPTSTPGQLLDVSPPPDCVLSCFETAAEDHVASLITSSAIKCCPLDPAPAVILKECVSVILPVITKIVNIRFRSSSALLSKFCYLFLSLLMAWLLFI